MNTNKETKKSKADSGFACMECGYKFLTLAAAKKVACGDEGCPKCGSSRVLLDIAEV